MRQRKRSAGQVERALGAERSLIRTWAMRGTLHLLPVEEAADYLALSGANRWWEKASWQKTFGHPGRPRGHRGGDLRRPRR